MRSTLIDAGPLIALFDRSDKYHTAAMRFIENYHGSLVTTWPVVTEAHYMLNFSLKSQSSLLEWMNRGAVQLFSLSETHLERLLFLTKKYDDVPMDLADATLMVAAEEMKINEIVSIDSDFYIYRNIRNEYLTNIFR
ncbi:MAG: PIN domain-containing protein [Cyclobacteriaceae bacterium]